MKCAVTGLSDKMQRRMIMTDTKKLIAKDLLSIKAVFFRPDEPFVWASGIKSPVYCDNRLTLTAPEVRNDVRPPVSLMPR